MKTGHENPPRDSDGPQLMSPESAGAARNRLLLADDSLQIREALAKVLRNAGYEVCSAADGIQVLDQLRERDFGLVLLDLNMPGMSGWDIVDEVARLRPTLPVVIITEQPLQKEWAESLGADALLEKPLDLPLLLETVRAKIQRASDAAESASQPCIPRRRFSRLVRPQFRWVDPLRGWSSE